MSKPAAVLPGRPQITPQMSQAPQPAPPIARSGVRQLSASQRARRSIRRALGVTDVRNATSDAQAILRSRHLLGSGNPTSGSIPSATQINALKQKLARAGAARPQVIGGSASTRRRPPMPGKTGSTPIALTY